MPMYYLTLAGCVMAVLGAWLVRKFSVRANRVGIGSFTLLPLAGIACTIGILFLIVGVFFILLGIFG